VRAISTQLAQHIENLRLLAQAERYRAEAEQAIQRLTHEGWNSFLQTHNELEPGYVFDLAEVKSLAEKNNGHLNYAVKQPMVVGDQVIGELAVDGPDQAEEAAEVIAAVAEQLSGHIENLRLSELNERHAQREQTLRQITSALRSSNNPATIMRTAVRELGSIMGRRTVVQLATPQESNQAQSAAGNNNESGAPAHQS
jgi:GAF domain-containing protein